MAALTITDLNNAKLDVDHIAALATSAAATATDRLGNVKDTLKGAIDTIKAFNSRGAWVTATVYAVKDLVSQGGVWYACVVAHTSSAAFATDSATKWRVHQGVTGTDLGAGSVASVAVGAPLPGVNGAFSVTRTITVHADYAYIDDSTINYSSAAFQGHASFDCNVKVTGIQDSDHHHEFQGYTHYQSSGALGRFSAFWSQLDHTGTGVISEASLFKANNPSGSGPISSLYAFYADTMTRGTANWGFYAPGATPHLLGGVLNFGTAGLTAQLKYDSGTGNFNITPRVGYHTSITAGSLLVGVTALASAEKVNITGSTTDYLARFYNAHATSPKGLAIIFSAAAPNGTGNEAVYFQDSVAIRWKCLSNGNQVNVNNSYGAISDIKVKERISDATPKLDKLMLIRIVDYFLKTDPQHKLIGVIAQELEEIFPGLVEETTDFEDVEITPARYETQQRQVMELCSHEYFEPELIDGKWTRVTKYAKVEQPLHSVHPLFDTSGAPIMEIAAPQQNEERDQTGKIVKPFAAAVMRQAVHAAPVMESVRVFVPATSERRPTGTVTKSVKYSVFVPILIKAMQEQQQVIVDHGARIGALESAEREVQAWSGGQK